MPNIDLWMLVIFLTWCSALFLYDALIRRVPNKLLILAIFLQLGLFLILGHGLNGTTAFKGLIGFVIALIFFLPLYCFRAMAAGDVKFFAVIGLLLGPAALLPVFLIGSLLAGLYALIYTVFRTRSVPALETIMTRLKDRAFYQRILQARGKRVGIPYVSYLAVGAVLVSMYPKFLDN
ncbi:prepilin peptidase [Glaciimonas sp. PAMC28666]|uniref:A24 family peptidase n=1 Tax=Glaciimonas sp. PAMC28666 TaxID=2807626 RepID=UPI001962D63B|nr:prepilin peptidase [Glaciimonas sp. PAMC28666]QRX83035.1 prepilin peptidase [Glaciimonas sp. PAMC28666]